MKLLGEIAGDRAAAPRSLTEDEINTVSGASLDIRTLCTDITWDGATSFKADDPEWDD